MKETALFWTNIKTEGGIMVCLLSVVSTQETVTVVLYITTVL